MSQTPQKAEGLKSFPNNYRILPHIQKGQQFNPSGFPDTLSPTSASTFISVPAMHPPTDQNQNQAQTQASPQVSPQQRLDGRLEVRHATLLAHISARYARIVDDDRRRRAAYQEAAYQRAMEIDVEERWGRELSHLIGLTSPALPMSASTSTPTSTSTSPSPPASHAQSHTENTYLHPLVEIQRDRDYLQLLIDNTDMHISALRDAHRVAFEREVLEAQLAICALRELEVRREALVLRREQEMRCAARCLPKSELVPMAKTTCTKVDCLRCSMDRCVSDSVAAVCARVTEMARWVDALSRA